MTRRIFLDLDAETATVVTSTGTPQAPASYETVWVYKNSADRSELERLFPNAQVIEVGA